MPLLGTLAAQAFSEGPILAQVYEQNIDSPAVLASAQLFGELVAAVEYNAGLLRTKGRVLTTGYLAVLVAAPGSAALLSVVR